MKLRHKETQEEFESDAIGCSTECVIDKHGERRVFRRSALEPVQPEPQWVDVTKECEYQVNGLAGALAHGSIGVLEMWVRDKPYRLRKVQGADVQPSQSAFVVEKRQS